MFSDGVEFLVVYTLANKGYEFTRKSGLEDLHCLFALLISNPDAQFHRHKQCFYRKNSFLKRTNRSHFNLPSIKYSHITTKPQHPGNKLHCTLRTRDRFSHTTNDSRLELRILIITDKVVQKGFIFPQICIYFLVFHNLVTTGEIEGVVHFDYFGVVFNAELLGSLGIYLLVGQIYDYLVEML